MNLCNASDVGMAETCCCCGGWVYAADNPHPIPGRVPSLQYCSPECHDDWEGFLSDQDERHRKRREFEDWENALWANAWDGKS
jgi:hypothetical protein